MPRGVRHTLHSGVSSVHLLGDLNTEVLARPWREGSDSACGFPGCARSVRTIDATYPSHLAPLYSHLQWSTFLDDLNRNLASTSVPDCPLLPLGFVLPPLFCLLRFCRSSRAADRTAFFEERIATENARLARAGLEWTEPVFTERRVCCVERVPELRGSIQLQMSLATRTQFELENPQAHQYLADLMLRRAERKEPLTVANSVAERVAAANGVSTELVEAQQRLVKRQASRRASLSATATTLRDSLDPAMAPSPAPSPLTPAEATARWAEASPRQQFRPITLDSPEVHTME